MGRIDRPTRPELPEPTNWSRIAKISAGVAGGSLLLWVAYVQTQGPDAIRVMGGPRRRPPGPSQVVFVREAREDKPAPKKIEEPPPATAEIVPEHVIAPAQESTAPTPSAQAPVPQEDAVKAATLALRERIAGCVRLEARSQVPTHSDGRRQSLVPVRVENLCGEDFPGADVWFDLAARRSEASGISAKGRFHFVATLAAKGNMERKYVLDCDPSYGYVITATAVREWFESPTE
jgi:hypothetical protein